MFSKERIIAALQLLSLLLLCCWLGQSWINGSLFFAFLMGMTFIRGRLWGFGGHIPWGTPNSLWRTGFCAPGCEACAQEVDICHWWGNSSSSNTPASRRDKENQQ